MEVNVSSIISTRVHIMFAFLCPKNYAMTMFEYKCNEWDLFQHHEWLLDHYFKHSGVSIDDAEKREILDFLKTRDGEQIKEAFLCPINRDATRKQHDCNDDYFLKDHNYNLLIRHYIEKGGAEAFAGKRKEFLCKPVGV